MINELTNIKNHKILVFDIETTSNFETFSDLEKHSPELAEEFIKKYNHSKEAQALIDSGEIGEDWGLNGAMNIVYQKLAPLTFEFGRIICISFTTIKFNAETDEYETQTKSFQGIDESVLLEKIKTVLSNQGWILAGQNINNFDIPFVIKRMIINGIKPPKNVLNQIFAKPWEKAILDLMDIWSMGGFGSSSKAKLGTICAVLNVPTPKDGIWGPDVPRFYWSGVNTENYGDTKFSQKDALGIITEYCEKDTEATAQCFIKLNELLF